MWWLYKQTSKVKGRIPITPTCLREDRVRIEEVLRRFSVVGACPLGSLDSRGNPGTLSILQYRFNQTKQHTHTKKHIHTFRVNFPLLWVGRERLGRTRVCSFTVAVSQTNKQTKKPNLFPVSNHVFPYETAQARKGPRKK